MSKNANGLVLMNNYKQGKSGENMAVLIIALALILVDLFTKRRSNPFITQLLCIMIPASQLIAPIILCFHFSSSSFSERNFATLYLSLLSWAAVVIYFSLRLMRSKYDFLSTTEKPLKLCAFGLHCNLFTLLTYFVGFIAAVVAFLLFSDVVLGALGGIMGLLLAYGFLLFLALIALLSLVFAPIGLAIIAIIAIDIVGSSIALAIIGIALVFVLAVPIVLGIRAVRAAAAQERLSGKGKVAFIVFMCFPLANTITLLVFRQVLKKRQSVLNQI